MNRILIFILPLLLACGNQEKDARDKFLELSKEERYEISQNSLKESIKKEQVQIAAYIKRKGGTFKETETGVHYFIYDNKHEGDSAKDGQLAEIKYTLTLLKGDTIQSNKQEHFVIAFQQKESGLHECIKKLTIGDKAIIIIPSYMAHGLMGDDHKIPSLTSLVYNLELLNLE
ncbi:MAG: FKBP-type peptidyl-prolyl cis-trans isomerase [Glaciecola sp.]